VKTKLCRKCGDEKSLDEFSKSKTTKDGRYSLCKKCKSAYKKKHKAKNPGRYLALNEGCRKRYEARHPDRVKAQQRKADEKRRARDACDPPKIKARQAREAKRKDRALHPEKYKARDRKKANAYRAKNREKLNAQQRDRYANDPVFRAKELERDKRRRPQYREAYRKRRNQNPEGFRAKQRVYDAKNRERHNAQQRLYRVRDPEKYRARSRKYRQQKKAEKLRLILPIALDILRDELVKGDHEEKLEKVRAQDRTQDTALLGARYFEKIKARQEREARKKDKALHPEKYERQEREYQKAYYAANRKKILAKAKADYAKNPEKYRAYQKKHLAKGFDHD